MIKKGDIVAITLNGYEHIGQVIMADYDSHRKTYNIEIDRMKGGEPGYAYWKQFSDGGTVRKLGDGPMLVVDGIPIIKFDIERSEVVSDHVIIHRRHGLPSLQIGKAAMRSFEEFRQLAIERILNPQEMLVYCQGCGAPVEPDQYGLDLCDSCIEYRRHEATHP